GDRPITSSALPIAAELQVSAMPAAAGTDIGKGSKSGRPAKHRSTVAPANLTLTVQNQRIKDIYRELQRLKVEEFANAGAVLIRVFLELTVDHVVKTKNVTVKPRADLGLKLQAVHDYLQADGTMTRAELAPIRRAISSAVL